ncbi:bifunctional protein-serine/threonine kinase/phosphatase [Sinorhizobium alkalisoli]|uniref:bifunctional protein-serine/threonine kinase/phosphatase n=1 Tax=Sinorhizobium alkalisoli TaxID=1752398 RepID=UPI00124CD57F|nr:bifunctional protein-serine/threonine kinase/phosphatase [Sinorhizobium alkalisoli]MCG5479146.1 bifunctional protein-serine/threonine kinase/phosphatase [Sinorhizobium alkalisoli]QFI70312.1 serine/threonine protein kinase [Sinorhizobium alkalisoli]
MLKSLTPGKLTVDLGQYSSAGRKTINQDFHGAIVPDGAALTVKGIALAIADGISSSPVSHIAAETAVKSFLTDYYCTSDAWTVKTAASRVIDATNSWLSAQNRGLEDRDHAHVTTFSALVLKGRRAHLFHVGDSRIWRLSGRSLEPLTTDHRLAPSHGESYLGRALGLLPSVEIDYRRLDLQPGDVFVLTTDGVHDSVSLRTIAACITSNADLSAAAAAIATSAHEAGSSDNLTIQIVRIEGLPEDDLEPVFDKADSLPPAPLPRVPCEFEGYQLHRQIHASHRSHIFLATEPETGERVALKFTSADMREDENYLRRFAMEEWIARRLSSVHVLKSRQPLKPRRFLYLVTEFVEGETLAQWMADRPQADLRAVRDIIGQIADGLRALHRKEIIHQDLRPENLMIDRSGTVKIIDFGSALVAGLNEAAPGIDRGDILGTVQYAAPEYFVGDHGSEQSDLYSVGVIAYQMLTGRLPYGAAVARTRNRRQQQKLRFSSLRQIRPDVPDWVEGAIRKAVHPDPAKRYQVLSEFVYDLSHPNPNMVATNPQSLMDRNPLLFWKCLTVLLSLVTIGLLLKDFG